MVSTWIFYCTRNNLPVFSDVYDKARNKLNGYTSLELEIPLVSSD